MKANELIGTDFIKFKKINIKYKEVIDKIISLYDISYNYDDIDTSQIIVIDTGDIGFITNKIMEIEFIKYKQIENFIKKRIELVISKKENWEKKQIDNTVCELKLILSELKLIQKGGKNVIIKER